MSTLNRAIRIFLKQDSGLETVEYAVITTIIISALVVALGALVLAVGDLYGQVANAIL